MLIVRQVKTFGEAWGDVGREQALSGGTTSCSRSTGVPAGGGGEVHLWQRGRKAQVLSVCTPYPGQEWEACGLESCVGLPGENRTRRAAVTIVTGNWFSRHQLICGNKGETKPPFRREGMWNQSGHGRGKKARGNRPV